MSINIDAGYRTLIEEESRVYDIQDRAKVVDALKQMGYKHEDRTPNEYGSFMMNGHLVADIQPAQLLVYTKSDEGKSLAQILSGTDTE